MDRAIRITGLVKRYRHPVLDRLDLEIDGGVFALLGRNGAGKSTLVSILTTLVAPDAGTATICGVDVVRSPAAARRRIGATGQEATLDQLLTGRENLVMLSALLGLGRRGARRADELLEQFALVEAADRPVSGYSGGMRRRLDLAASFITQPPVLFLDEPTTGLDPLSRRSLWDDVRRFAATGTTVFLTTQTLDEAEALADRIAVLEHGRIIADGTAAELTARVGGSQLVLLDDAGDARRSIDTDGSAASIRAALDALPETDRGARVELRTPTLDDAFRALVGSTPEGRS
ncbi:ATP-binding cassette domain-containing protein [Leucobacter allii]|uniref:ATP-binding cassette domain-containing protein n=1 Tax=Leucobacter allii TaxID=2932247 RepID=A0ABY4FPJ4_9MICO|nr:ATP-binding cassette domain-containing protein [Leucobacter allii]UOQ58203.1 ATP-binding cassette domain-containing protein [Leucobacter allii]